jgi:hypothetical protein
MFVDQFNSLLNEGWNPVFSQTRTLERAIEHAMAMPSVLGRRTVSRTICALGRSPQDWSADYKMFSRSLWNHKDLFDPVIEQYLRQYPKGPIAVAGDDTKLHKTGKKIKTASWQRDPLSPPFHTNLIWSLRFLQFSLLFPHYREGDFPARSIPVRFEEVPVVKKPGKRATAKQRKEYKLAQKQKNLSTRTLVEFNELRERFDKQGASERDILAALDGSFCNQTIFKADLKKVELVARCRKDARLCFPAAEGRRRKYDPEIFTPEEIRLDSEQKWKETKIHFGGKWRKVKYKEVRNVLWRRGAATRRLRLIVIAPVPYKLSRNAKINYRQPAYLLSTDLKSTTKLLIQTCFDRWQIEVNHKEEKSLLGVGQAQVWSSLSVPRLPAFSVATYSMLLLASLKAYGPGRTADYLELPKWRKNSKRPSLLDLMTLLRNEIHETRGSIPTCAKIKENLLLHAYT